MYFPPRGLIFRADVSVFFLFLSPFRRYAFFICRRRRSPCCAIRTGGVESTDGTRGSFIVSDFGSIVRSTNTSKLNLNSNYRNKRGIRGACAVGKRVPVRVKIFYRNYAFFFFVFRHYPFCRIRVTTFFIYYFIAFYSLLSIIRSSSIQMFLDTETFFPSSSSEREN